jgi:hypothetical protein
MRRSGWTVIAAVILLCAGESKVSAQNAATATITAADVQRHLATIAHDSMRGRDTPSPGLEMTAAYAAAQFASYGLKPAGDSGTFIQRYPYAARRTDHTARMIEVSGKPAFAPVFARDYFVVPSAEPVVETAAYYIGTAAPGMEIPEAARGSIFVAAVPDTIAPGAWQERLSAVFPLAMRYQARGVILLLDPAVSAESLTRIAGPISEQVAPFPVFGLRWNAGSELVAGTGLDSAALFASAGAAPRALTGLRLKMRTPVTVTMASVPNVVAVLPGSDAALKDEYVVFSAHMDHVGVGPADADGDSIFNGADDDASGTSAIMEIAQAFASRSRPPARSVIFLLVSGEEKGLLGSEYFTANPPVPIGQIVANINIDMIGRNHPDSVTAIGLDYTSLGPLALSVAAANPSLRLAVATDHQPEERLFERSDHFNFAVRNVPAIFFTTGLHSEYHHPADEPETIDNEKLARVARLAYLLGEAVAQNAARPTWTAAGLDVVRAALAQRAGQ